MATGITGNAAEGGQVGCFIYWDANFIPTGNQDMMDAPLINGPQGYCMYNWNTTGLKRVITVTDSTGATLFSIRFPVGDPITTGQARSRTAAQMAALGYTTRRQVSGVSIA